MALSATVLGASGYSGAEVLRLVSGHPGMELTAAGAHGRAGGTIPTVLPHLAGLGGTLVSLEAASATRADVCFSCLPGGVLPEVVPRVKAPLVIDLSDDFRSEKGWIYGLTEFARGELKGASRVANPGCYPTAVLMCLVPFARAGVAGAPIVVDALSGVSGAGRKAEDRLLFAQLSGGAAAYGTTEHRHVAEMERGLARFGGLDASVSFTPHLVPMPRGILVTARARLTTRLSDADAIALLEAHYSNEGFVSVTEDWPSTKPVTGTNRVHLSARIDRRNSMLICSAAMDNLGKGAAGQALQNANVALGIEESSGLEAYGIWP
ncbi:MAG: N-acetyl-gamma-glutamyl-phosphate reductase [Actinomycetota bacterium]